MADIIEFSGEERYQPIAGVLRPCVYYFLRLDDRVTPVQVGIVDSGADQLMIPQFLGPLLGLNLAELPRRRIFTLAGQVHVMPSARVTLVCHGASADVEVIFSPLRFAFLGRAGLFEHFIFGIDEARQRVLIHRRNR
jgi:hypothetical protein